MTLGDTPKHDPELVGVPITIASRLISLQHYTQIFCVSPTASPWTSMRHFCEYLAPCPPLRCGRHMRYAPVPANKSRPRTGAILRTACGQSCVRGNNCHTAQCKDVGFRFMRGCLPILTMGWYGALAFTVPQPNAEIWAHWIYARLPDQARKICRSWVLQSRNREASMLTLLFWNLKP